MDGKRRALRLVRNVLCLTTRQMRCLEYHCALCECVVGHGEFCDLLDAIKMQSRLRLCVFKLVYILLGRRAKEFVVAAALRRGGL
jgi:hypothetical protein